MKIIPELGEKMNLGLIIDNAMQNVAIEVNETRKRCLFEFFINAFFSV
jgi:hypothetical protein